VLSIRNGLIHTVVSRLGYPKWDGPLLTLPASEKDRRAFIDEILDAIGLVSAPNPRQCIDGRPLKHEEY
jgi:hypothetical protein